MNTQDDLGGISWNYHEDCKDGDGDQEKRHDQDKDPFDKIGRHFLEDKEMARGFKQMSSGPPLKLQIPNYE